MGEFVEILAEERSESCGQIDEEEEKKRTNLFAALTANLIIKMMMNRYAERIQRAPAERPDSRDKCSSSTTATTTQSCYSTSSSDCTKEDLKDAILDDRRELPRPKGTCCRVGSDARNPPTVEQTPQTQLLAFEDRLSPLLGRG